jgi:hypothetical protein
MRRITSRLRTLTYGAVILGAMAYGVTTAWATPTDRGSTVCEYRPNVYVCMACCVNSGMSYNYYYYPTGACYCY